MRYLSSGKLVITVLALVCILSLSGFACSSQPKPAESTVSPPNASIIVNPAVVKLADASAMVYGSGFTPKKSVTVLIVGTFKGAQNPPLGSAVANDNGAMQITLTTTGVWGTGADSLQIPAGNYTLEAWQLDKLVTTSPFVLVK